MTVCDIHCPFIGCASCEYAGGVARLPPGAPVDDEPAKTDTVPSVSNDRSGQRLSESSNAS